MPKLTHTYDDEAAAVLEVKLRDALATHGGYRYTYTDMIFQAVLLPLPPRCVIRMTRGRETVTVWAEMPGDAKVDVHVVQPTHFFLAYAEVWLALGGIMRNNNEA